MSLLNVAQDDPNDQNFINKIKEFGHTIQYVASAEGEEWKPPFAYSTGGFESYNAPEIIVSGLSLEISKWIINYFMAEWQAGKKFVTRQKYEGFLEGHPVMFLKAAQVAKKEYACFADWHYERKEFPIWQLIWPGSGHGKFPWEIEDEMADVHECLVEGGWPAFDSI